VVRFMGFLFALWAVAIAMVQSPGWLRSAHAAIQGFLARAAWDLWMPVIQALQKAR
jgi:hypothetical protein